MKLEEKLDKLDKLARQIDDEQSLEKSLKLFEEGVELAADCIATLDDCSGRLTVLQQKVKEMVDNGN